MLRGNDHTFSLDNSVFIIYIAIELGRVSNAKDIFF